MKIQRFACICFAATGFAVLVHAQVTYERLLDAAKDPANWMTYSGSYRSWRYSSLEQVSR